MTDAGHLYQGQRVAALARYIDSISEDLEAAGIGYARLTITPNVTRGWVTVRIDCEHSNQWAEWISNLMRMFHGNEYYRVEPMIWPTLTVWLLPNQNVNHG